MDNKTTIVFLGIAFIVFMVIFMSKRNSQSASLNSGNTNINYNDQSTGGTSVNVGNTTMGDKATDKVSGMFTGLFGKKK